MSEPDLLYEVKDAAAWLTINREARRNALSIEMMDLFNEYLDRAEADHDIRVICVTAAGEKAFCSGADLATTFEGADHVAGARTYANLLRRMSAIPKPIVARVNGHCIAGGLGLMLSCDIVYAREGVKFGTPEVNVGLFPMMIGALMFRNCFRKKALEMVYTARMLTASEAEDMGLITRVVPGEELDSVVHEALSTIASKAPLAIELGKRAYDATKDLSLDEALDYLCDQLGTVVATEDAKEGLMAFMQKRHPQWNRR